MLIVAWNWIKKYAGWPFALVGIFLGARAIIRSQSNRISGLKDALTVEQERRKIAAAEERVKLKTEQAISKGLEVDAAVVKMREAKRRVVEIESKKPTENMTDEQIAQEFSKLNL
jgi:hypothetical protein